MRRTLPALFLIIAIASPTLADLRATVDLLDPSDGGPQPPAGVLVIDVLVDVDAGDAWLLGAVAASTVGGSTIIYGDADPNNPLVNPGATNPFVTCVSVPLPRFGPGRFNACRAAVIGSPCPLRHEPFIESTRVGANWYDEVLIGCIDRPTENGAILRIAVAIEPSLTCAGDVGCCFAIYPDGEVPDEAIPVLEGDCFDERLGQPPIGIAWATCHRTLVEYRGWVLAQTPTAGSCRYDVNRDRTIDVQDLAIVLASFGATDGQPEFDPRVDFDADGQVELQDLATFLSHMGVF
jgi:hypothetical protein